MKILNKLINSDSKDTMQMVINILQLKGYTNIIATDDYLLAEGDLPIGIVCHTDTVWDNNFKEIRTIYHDREQKVAWCCPTGGFDDKAGIAILILLLSQGFKPHIILCDKEERGALGAIKLTTDYPQCPFDIKYIIELDRRGQNDCVFYIPAKEEFVNYIESFGFKQAEGTFSDVLIIESVWKIACVNLSCGYINEHTPHEVLHMDWLSQTLHKVEKMIADLPNAPYYKSNVTAPIGGWTADTDLIKCNVCDDMVSLRDIDWVTIGDTQTQITICSKCEEILRVNQCQLCGEYYWNPERTGDCPYCKGVGFIDKH